MNAARPAPLGAADRPPDARDGWLEAVRQICPVPDGYRRETVARTVALDMLRCGEGILDLLVAAGLPHSGRPGAELFDWYDLFNVAIYSGSRASLPERSLRFALRWMGRPADTWTSRRAWRFSLAAKCTGGSAGSSTCRWRVALPAPAAPLGALTSLSLEPNGAVRLDQGAAVSSGPHLELTARVEIGGAVRTLRSPVLRRVLADFLAQGYRWVRLPEELQARPDLVHKSGIATCISASLTLRDVFRRNGYRVRTRRGWILGMLDLAHSWLEVVDDDGEIKAIDPAFVLLSAHAEQPDPGFVIACHGTFFNRLLSTGHEANQPLVRHLNAHPDCRPDVRITIAKA